MTFREQSERMFAGVLVAAVLHAALLIGVHKLFDLRFEDYTRPLTVRLLAPEARDASVREQRPLPPKQEEAAPAVAVPKPAPQQVATPRPAARPQPAPERATAQEPAPVRTQPRTESAPAEAPAGPVAAWTPALRQSVESAPVRGRGGLHAVPGDAATQAGPPADAAAGAPASFAGEGDLPTTFKDGLALPVDESVYARSASSRAPGSSAARGVSSDDSVRVVRDLGQSGTNRDATAPRDSVRMIGTPRRADASGTGTGGAVPAAPPADSAPLPAANKPAGADATLIGSAASRSHDAEGIGSADIDRLVDALNESGLDSTASTGADQGASAAADGAAGPPGPGVRLREGWDVSGPLGQRRLLKPPVYPSPERYPELIVRETVRVQISVDSKGQVTVEGFDRGSASAELNNAITEALRQWLYEPVPSQDPVEATVTIQIRNRSTEVVASGQ